MNAPWTSSIIQHPHENLSNNKIPAPFHIAVSLDSLFDMTEAQLVMTHEGKRAYANYTHANLQTPLHPGKAFPFLAKMLSFNEEGKDPLVRVTVLSRCKMPTTIRAQNSIRHHGLLHSISSHQDRYLSFNNCQNGVCSELSRTDVDLYLSTRQKEVEGLLSVGFAAGLIAQGPANDAQFENGQNIVIASDFDRVLGIACGCPGTKDQHLDSVDVTMKNGQKAAWAREIRNRKVPAHQGPMASPYIKLFALSDIVNPDPRKYDLILPLVTARTGASLPRVRATLKAWEIDLPEDHLCSTGYYRKGETLDQLGADIFFDDSPNHIEEATRLSPRTAAILVPWV